MRRIPTSFVAGLVTLVLVMLGWPVVASQWGYPYPYPPYGGYRLAAPDSSVRLDVKPRDAQVYVDGYYAGLVDRFDGTFQRLHVEPGQHEIIIYKEGYRSVRERLYLPPNSSRKITHELAQLGPGETNEPIPMPAPPPETAPDELATPRGRGAMPPRRSPDEPQTRQDGMGSATIRVQPDDAEIFIDGERWVTGGDALVVQLTEGRHRVEVRKEGFKSVTLEVQVRSGEIAPVNVTLTRN